VCVGSGTYEHMRRGVGARAKLFYVRFNDSRELGAFGCVRRDISENGKNEMDELKI